MGGFQAQFDDIRHLFRNIEGQLNGRFNGIERSIADVRATQNRMQAAQGEMRATQDRMEATLDEVQVRLERLEAGIDNVQIRLKNRLNSRSLRPLKKSVTFFLNSSVHMQSSSLNFRWMDQDGEGRELALVIHT